MSQPSRSAGTIFVYISWVAPARQKCTSNLPYQTSMCTLYITHVHCVKKHVYSILAIKVYTPIVSDTIHSATVLLYHTHSHPHYRILMGHLVSFLPHLPRHPPSLLRPYTPHLPTRHSKSPLVMNNSQQFLLDFTHTHTQTVNKVCKCVCSAKCSG